MMADFILRKEERVGLAVALAAHVALAALLVLRPATSAPDVKPERISVTISDDVGLTSAAPAPVAAPAPEQAPDAGEAAPAPAEAMPPEPEPIPAPKPAVAPPPPKPVVRAAPAPRVAPKPPPPKPAPPTARPSPRPVAKAAPRPTPHPTTPATRPAATRPTPARATTARPAANTASRPTSQPGASRIGSDFLKGAPNARATGTSQTQSAATIGPAVRVSLAQSVLRQVRPNWQGRVPQGLNTDRIVSVVSIELNPDGTLARTPSVIRQEGVDDSNRAQAQRHAEEAVRAVQLSAPFDLPSELYQAWKKLPPLRFRKSI